MTKVEFSAVVVRLFNMHAECRNYSYAVYRRVLNIDDGVITQKSFNWHNMKMKTKILKAALFDVKPAFPCHSA